MPDKRNQHEIRYGGAEYARTEQSVILIEVKGRCSIVQQHNITGCRYGIFVQLVPAGKTVFEPFRCQLSVQQHVAAA